MSTLRFALGQCPAASDYLHLVLRLGSQRLAHWVLPRPLNATRRCGLPGFAVLTEAAAAGQPLPPGPSQAEGPCAVAYNGRRYRTSVRQLQAALCTGHLRLELEGPALRGAYVLSRLRPGGPAWVLNALAPEQAPRPVPAPPLTAYPGRPDVRPHA